MEIDQVMVDAATASREKRRTGNGLTFALQALLNRHESYVTESQLEHERLTSYVNELEKERNSLQAANEKVVEENRELLNRLESANTSLKESDEHVKSLETLLRDCESEVRRLNGLSRQTEELELKMLDLERERIRLSEKVEESEEETRSTVQRWKESVLKVRQLEYEVQRIEWEAKQDRQRHEETIARLERERALERELGGAEGRLKGAAALQGLKGNGVTKNNVVSHFVRDILQDNANLQAGIAELRELLQNSNDEVQNLREQIMHHQPVDYDHMLEDPPISRPLSEQIDWAESCPKQVQQEVHVHHHYHAKLAARRDRTPTVRRTTRKRPMFGLGALPATPESSAPKTPLSGSSRYVSSPVVPLALHHPQPRYNRWSVQSAATVSSMLSSFPSSPRSYYEPSSSIFDRIEASEDSSRPTSPESAAGFAEPGYKSFKSRLLEDAVPHSLDEEDLEHAATSDDSSDAHDLRGLPPEEVPGTPAEEDEADEVRGSSQDLTPKPSQILVTAEHDDCEDAPGLSEIRIEFDGQDGTTSLPKQLEIRVEEHESVWAEEATKRDSRGIAPTQQETGFDDFASHMQMRHRRTNSHESLVSISGMDIHLAKRPATATSQASSLLKGNRAYFALSPSAARRLPAAQPSTTVTEFTALSSPRSISSNSIPSPNAYPSQSIEALSGLAGLPKISPAEQHHQSGGFGRLVGGWVKGRWGPAPTKLTSELKALNSNTSPGASSNHHQSQAKTSSSSPAPASSAATEGPLRSTLTSSSSSAPPPPPALAAASSLSSSLSTSSFSSPHPPPLFLGGRAPGINQKGMVPGFRPAKKPANPGVELKMVDVDGLKESLAE
ncbi:hypothetical protein PV08_10952 [Exophiala spinifera]|uniref:Uncharacterized protein n=1 Tax=Exophiala spinifera TaxID=91928 RepID=A0A0D2AYX3_9EURO|nr:uncharacterized protein PV08_10952 [Exophiala spinifera]KIW11650.1 hypothetical protein PV08_10952 [Exophiala spinifera]